MIAIWIALGLLALANVALAWTGKRDRHEQETNSQDARERERWLTDYAIQQRAILTALLDYHDVKAIDAGPRLGVRIVPRDYKSLGELRAALDRLRKCAGGSNG